MVEAERRGLVNTVDQDFELQVYLPDEEVPRDPQDADLASEEPKEDGVREGPREGARARGNGRGEGRQAREERGSERQPEQRPSFDLLEDLTPYEFKTVCTSVASLEQPASFVEIFSSIRELDRRGELELSQEEIGDVINAMLEADFLNKVRQKPYKEAKADMTFYALNADKQEVKSALNGG